MGVELYEHQLKVLNKLDSGSILKGGVGTGKSLTSLAYYHIKECGGKMKVNGKGSFEYMTKPKDLYIITTARKRDTFEWDKECLHFYLSRDKTACQYGINVVIDSWNNIKKYVDVKHAFFIFDEQRLVGTGAWTKAFYKIAKNNRWILLTATPGDTWSDYAPVFIANGFYKNITEFRRKHAIYSRYSKYPKIEGYFDTGILMQHRKRILISMDYKKKTIRHEETMICDYDKVMFDRILKDRWNPFDDKPIKDVLELYKLMRMVVNGDPSRLDTIKKLMVTKKRIIIFYNFNYELDILRKLNEFTTVAEWNGHKHEPVPDTDEWIYLVHYSAGAEGWNCITTDTILYYSLNYSYKLMHQASGRIDRINTPYTDLYYYTLQSKSFIDFAITKSLSKKENFQERPIPVPKSQQKHVI